jgi:hypothetical protein
LIFLERLASFIDDPLCGEKFMQALSTSSGKLEANHAKIRLPFVQKGFAKLGFAETESVLEFVEEAFRAQIQSRRTHDSAQIFENFEIAVAFCNCLIDDLQFAARFDPIDQGFAQSAANFACMNPNGKITTMVVELFAHMATVYGAGFRRVLLEELRDMLFNGDFVIRQKTDTLLMICRVVVRLFDEPQVVSQEVANLFVEAIRGRTDDCLSLFSDLIGEGDVPEWAKCFFVTSKSFIKWAEGRQPLKIAEKVVPTLSLQQAKEFLEKEFINPPHESKEWRLAELVFKSFPDGHSELRSVFPQKLDPDAIPSEVQPIFDLIYK